MTTINIPADLQTLIISYANSAVTSIAHKSFSHQLSDTDIEDIVGDTIYKACRSIATYDPSKGKFYTWVHTTAYRCILTYLNKYPPFEDFEHTDEEGDVYTISDVIGYRGYEFSADRDIIASQFKDEWTECTSVLDPIEKKILDYIVADVTPKEVAAETGLTPNAASIRMSRVRSQIKDGASKIAREFDIHSDKLAA